MDRQELSAVLAIALLYVIRMLGLFMVLPVLPLLGPEYEGGTPMAIGLALGWQIWAIFLLSVGKF